VVAFVEFPDPLVNKEIADIREPSRAWAIANDCVPTAAHKSKHSETPYRLSIAFNINFGPLAPRACGSRSMKSGGLTC